MKILFKELFKLSEINWVKVNVPVYKECSEYFYIPEAKLKDFEYAKLLTDTYRNNMCCLGLGLYFDEVIGSPMLAQDIWGSSRNRTILGDISFISLKGDNTTHSNVCGTLRHQHKDIAYDGSFRMSRMRSIVKLGGPIMMSDYKLIPTDIIVQKDNNVLIQEPIIERIILVKPFTLDSQTWTL